MIDLARELQVLMTGNEKQYVAYIQARDQMWVARKLAEHAHKEVSKRLIKELKNAYSH